MEKFPMSEANKQRIQEHIRRSTGINYSERSVEKNAVRKRQIMEHLRQSTEQDS